MTLQCELVSNGISLGNPSWEHHPRLAALSSGARDWILLLQVDTDDDRTWTILQCT